MKPNPHPSAWKIIRGLNYRKARKLLKEFGCSRSYQNLIISMLHDNIGKL